MVSTAVYRKKKQKKTNLLRNWKADRRGKQESVRYSSLVARHARSLSLAPLSLQLVKSARRATSTPQQVDGNLTEDNTIVREDSKSTHQA
jgi:hypothetical protein